MKIEKFTVSCLAVAVLVLAFAADTFACACCAEPGHYKLSTGKPSAYQLDLIDKFTFAPKAELYMTEAGFDMIEGLDPVAKENEATQVAMHDNFDLTAAFQNRRSWKFDFKTPKGLRGSFTLPIPTQMVDFAVDIHDEENRPNGPLLYKEFRFKGTVSAATGFAKAGFTRGTTYFLVFQGRGVGCDEVSNFKNWRLEIDGPRASYAFFGKLSSADLPDGE